MVNLVAFYLRISGDVKDIIHGIPWRFADDFTLISFSKEVMPLCQFLRKLAVDNGLSEVEIPDHSVTQRMTEAGDKLGK